MAVSGDYFESKLTTDKILQATNGGYDIYMFYLGKVKRIMKRPWLGEKEEKDPSWGITPSKGRSSTLPIWFWKDFSREESGTAIQFVQKYFGLEYEDARDKIAWDFGLGGKIINAKPVQVTWEAPNVERDYADIKFSTQPFKSYHHEFWNIAEVAEEDLKKLNYFAVKDIALRGRRINIKPNEPVFAFYSPEEDGVKIYFPQRKERRFLNNVSYHYLWNFSDLKDCENLFVQKSPKDLAVTRMLTPCVTATQAEAVRIFFDKEGHPTEVVKKINNITKKPWIFYGSDDDGVKKCKEITETAKYRYINTPKKYLPDVNDVYGFVKMHNLQVPNTGLKALEEFMKSKKALK